MAWGLGCGGVACDVSGGGRVVRPVGSGPGGGLSSGIVGVA